MAELLQFPAPASRPVPPGTPPDREAREKALDIRHSWIVEAPAGSGKTGLLIQRYLKLLADESVTDPGQVLAITFTIKAANEMRDRVLAQLDGAARETVPGNAFDQVTRPLAKAVLGRDEESGWGLLERPQQAAGADHRFGLRGDRAIAAGALGRGRLVDHQERLGASSRSSRTDDVAAGRQDTELSGARDADAAPRRQFGELRGADGGDARMARPVGRAGAAGKEDLDDAYLEGVVLPKIERALEQAVSRGLTYACV